ncbi:MAG: hypothetical protein M3Q17_08810 [Actinomycetota bacterium]|nr:hypothetical protein [Actinomycetota bacterium]
MLVSLIALRAGDRCPYAALRGAVGDRRQRGLRGAVVDELRTSPSTSRSAWLTSSWSISSPQRLAHNPP